MLKKLLALLMALALVFALAACGGKSDEDDKKKKKDKDTEETEETGETDDETEDDDEDDDDIGYGKGDEEENEDIGYGKGDEEEDEDIGYGKDDNDENNAHAPSYTLNMGEFNNCSVTMDVVFIADGERNPVEATSYDLDGERIGMNGAALEEDAETAYLVRNVMIAPVLNFIADVNDLTYNSAEGAYEADGPVTCEVSFTDNAATLTATDISFTVDADGHLASFSCKMHQEGVSFGEEVEFNLEVTYTFENYGLIG